MFLADHLHPALSGLPISLLVSALICELIAIKFRANRSKVGADLAATLLITIAFVACIAAFLSGYLASEAANKTFQVADNLISQHHSWGRMMVLVLFPIWVFRALMLIRSEYLGQPITALVLSAYISLLFAVTCLCAYTSYLGGELVFTHGAGVSVIPRGADVVVPLH